MNATECINDRASTSAAGAVEIVKVDDEIASILTQDCVAIDCNDFKFYLGFDEMSPTVREVQDEYQRSTSVDDTSRQSKKVL
ncbi:hypothetical protein TNCV_4046031 [Trichonephila clavipes]|nr:hypothetical protein TNCV_4046031 [Trichonephila clavipes]